MAFWDVFKNNEVSKTRDDQSSLYHILQSQFPDLSDENLIKTTCIAGLLARVAYVDFDLDEGEEVYMLKAITDFGTFSESESKIIVEIATSHIKELAGLENHLYVHSLKAILDKNARFSVVETLFALAASDGIVENVESEEIRIIVKGFELSDQHFLAARAKVADKLGVLKS